MQVGRLELPGTSAASVRATERHRGGSDRRPVLHRRQRAGSFFRKRATTPRFVALADAVLSSRLDPAIPAPPNYPPQSAESFFPIGGPPTPRRRSLIM